MYHGIIIIAIRAVMMVRRTETAVPMMTALRLPDAIALMLEIVSMAAAVGESQRQMRLVGVLQLNGTVAYAEVLVRHLGGTAQDLLGTAAGIWKQIHRIIGNHPPRS